MQHQTPQFVIAAEIHSDDSVAATTFDALQWFRSALDQEIADLAAIEWGGDYAADHVAIALDHENIDIHRVFDYLAARNRANPGDPIGFEVHIKEEDALEWLKENRPELHDRISGADKELRKSVPGVALLAAP
jgi:hypothetical protein